MGMFTIRILGDIILFSLKGKLDIESFANLLSEIDTIEAGTGKLYHRFADFTEVTETEIDYNQLEELANRRRKKYANFSSDNPIQTSILVNDQITFGMARTYEMLTEQDGFHIKVFTDKNKALAWINAEHVMTNN